MSTTQRANFTTKLGVIAATVGAAVGLGNIWRFPYTAGVNGGGAFLVIYLVCVLLVGLPLLMSELFLGRNTGQNPKGAFRALSKNKKWQWVGILCLLSPTMVLGFYSVVAGWTAEYFLQSITGNLAGKNAAELGEIFTTFSQDPLKPIMWLFVFLGLTIAVSLGGIKNGIERVSNILMPILFFLLIVLGIKSLTLEGASEGLKFLFKPDFSKISPMVVLEALGQAFFSLSIGLGISITYASYFKKETNMPQTSVIIAFLDTMVAILAGIIIFPAVFTFGINPGQGPELVFITLPSVFNQMVAGQFWGTMFFLLLAVAALTSTISLSEVIVTFLVEEYKLTRKKAVLMLMAVCGVIGVVSSLSLGIFSEYTLFGKNAFSLIEYIASNLLLPIAGFFIAIFVGWKLPKKVVHDELTTGAKFGAVLFNLYMFALRFIAPIGIIIVLLTQLGVI
ncbi:MAG: sodium-dependent transporter [Bacteroidales bacterium]